jgi:hypothetical protein
MIGEPEKEVVHQRLLREGPRVNCRHRFRAWLSHTPYSQLRVFILTALHKGGASRRTDGYFLGNCRM